MENQSIELKELLTALCKAQSEYPDIPKTRVGQEGHRKFKYADLNDIHKATRQINTKHGLSTPHETTDTHLITSLYHAPSGQRLKTSLPIKLSDNPKHTGATLTYLKRYNIQSLLDISTEEDLDSINTQNPDEPKETPKNTPTPKQEPAPNIVSELQLKRLFAISSEKKWTHDQVKSYMEKAWGLNSSKDLSKIRYDILIGIIQSQSYEEAIKK